MDLKDLYIQYCLRVDLYWYQKLLTAYLHQTLEGHIWCLYSSNDLPTDLNRIIYSYTVYERQIFPECKYIRAYMRWSRDMDNMFQEQVNRIMYENVDYPICGKFSFLKRGLLVFKRLKRPKPDNDLRHPYYHPFPRNYNSWERGIPESVTT